MRKRDKEVDLAELKKCLAKAYELEDPKCIVKHTSCQSSGQSSVQLDDHKQKADVKLHYEVLGDLLYGASTALGLIFCRKARQLAQEYKVSLGPLTFSCKR
ncbi:hypothetical protein EJB05_05307, partial [Eragrostis curvula]